VSVEGSMAVENSQLNSAGRDAYWRATQLELESAKQRGDILSLVGLGLIAALLWYYREPDNDIRISAARGMNCQHCGYVPHHTEISEVVSTRQCRRCEKPLG
jgi:hypothetical protein